MEKRWVSRWFSVFAALLVLVAGLVAAPPAFAEEEGIPVEVRVLDGEGNPVPTAVIRHPQEEERHRVNTVTGSWKASVLYLPTGEDLKFTKGMELELEISAPGYISETVRYLVRKRKNVIIVTLATMDAAEDLDDFDDPVIQFGRDKPIDGLPAEPAQ